jgi:hypothetical protein
MSDFLKQKVEDEVAKASAKEFFKGIEMINGARQLMSKNQFWRALCFALNNKLTDKKIELLTENEKTLANILAVVLDHRTIMQANLMQRMEKENGLGQQTNEEVRSETSEQSEETEVVADRDVTGPGPSSDV